MPRRRNDLVRDTALEDCAGSTQADLLRREIKRLKRSVVWLQAALRWALDCPLADGRSPDDQERHMRKREDVLRYLDSL